MRILSERNQNRCNFYYFKLQFRGCTSNQNKDPELTVIRIIVERNLPTFWIGCQFKYLKYKFLNLALWN